MASWELGSRAGNRPSAEAALARQSWRRRHRYSHRAHSLPDGSGRRRACVRGARLGSVQWLAAPFPSPWRCRIGDPARSRHLSPACHVPSVPALWRLHRMHHADLDIDVTTGVRFHPVEIVLSMLIKFAVIARSVHRPGGADIRGAAERHVDVQPQQRAHAAGRRPHRAPAGGDARHASRASLDRPGGDQQQFRLQLSLVGPAVRHLPRASRAKATTA